MPKKILSAGHNTALLKVRNSIIQAAGYQVVTTKEADLILEIARKGDFAAVVICSSVPAYQRRNLARELKRIKPGLPLVIICAYTEHAEFRTLAEEVIIAEHGVSQPLVEAISKLAGEPEL